MKLSQLCVVALVLPLGGQAEEARQVLLGNGVEVLSGDGSRANPFNKPHDEVELFRNLFAHRALHKERLDAALKEKREMLQTEKLHGMPNIEQRELDSMQAAVLDRCWELDASSNPFGEYTHLHPCFNKNCEVKKSSVECMDNVFDFCCDESLDSCNPSQQMLGLRGLTSCTAQTCTSFMRDSNDHHGEQPDFDATSCVFSNDAVCQQCDAERWQIHESYVFNGCEWDSNCIKHQVYHYKPAIAEMSNRLSRAARSGRVRRRGLEGGSNDVDEESLKDMCSMEDMARMFDQLDEQEVYSCFGVDQSNPLDDVCKGMENCESKAKLAFEFTTDENGQEDMGLVYCALLAHKKSYAWVTENWAGSGAVPDEWRYQFVFDFIETMSGCDNGGGEHHENDEHNVGGGGNNDHHDDNAPNFECSSPYLENLFHNMFVEYAIDDCTGELSNDLTCGKLMTCLPIVYNATEAYIYGFEVETNPFFGCLMLLSGAEESDYETELPNRWDRASSVSYPNLYEFNYVRQVVGYFGSCIDSGGGGQGDASNWDYAAQCKVEDESIAPKCGQGCCAMHDRVFEENGSDYGNSSQATFICGQLAKTGANEEEVKRCLRQTCGGCYEPNGGLWGPPGWDENQIDNPYSSSCVGTIHDHCQTNPWDPPCLETCPFTKCDARKYDNCPCEEESVCSGFYKANFTAQGKCREFYSLVKGEYLEQGFLYPETEWAQDVLRSAGVSLRKPTGNFTLSNATRQFGLQHGCGFIDEIVDCLGDTIGYCNTADGMWSSGCRQLSTCGDGKISWGESCDDGNDNQFQDGCRECQYVPQNWYCPAPGIDCEVCIQAPNEHYRGGRSEKSDGDENNGCPFCRNEKVAGIESPCFNDACREVIDYPSAKACDDVVHTYCNALTDAELHDPGCKDIVNKSVHYSVPQIPRCHFSVRDIDIAGSHLKSVKYAIIECPLVDPTGEGRDTTPWVPYWSPLYGVSDEDLSKLKGNNKTVLELLALADQNTLVPVTTLTDHETFPYNDVNIHKDGQAFSVWDNVFRNRLARVSIWSDPSNQWMNEHCSYPSGQWDLPMLPPCDDPMATVARQGLKRIKWSAVREGSWDFKDFEDMDLSDLSKFQCNPKPGTLQFALQISTTRMEWKGGREEPVERFEYNCNRYAAQNDGMWPNWNEYDKHCDRLDLELKKGTAKVSFGDKLFQSGCVDKDCKQVIAKCERVPIVEASPQVNLDLFNEKADNLLDSIYGFESADTWGQVRRLMIEISALAASGPIAGALDVFDEVTVKGTFTKVLKGVKDYCPHHHWIQNTTSGIWGKNPDWESDPCCNWELRAYECCPVQDIPGAVVETITDFNSVTMGKMCKSSEEIKQSFSNLFTTLETARKEAEKLAKKADPKQFENIWEFEDDCRSLIENSDGDVEINSQADCHCQYSTFVNDGSSKRCETDPDAWPKCYAECFREKYEVENPFILFFLKQEWNIGEAIYDSKAEENARFAQAWTEHMTESGCVGPESWRSDIGRSGHHWSCDQECHDSHTCTYWEALTGYLRDFGADKNIDAWQIMNNATKCAALGGSHICQWPSHDGESCYGHVCKLPQLDNMTIPCSQEEDCRNDCNAPCKNQDVCEAKGGTWMEDNDSCCPAGNYVRSENGWSQCSKVPPGKPNRWELRDELCCSAEGGSWRRTEWGGECCLFAQWEKRTYDGEEWWECRDWVDTWEECRECEKENCQPLRDACESCYEEREGCCSSEYVSQNKTACLSYERCNDGSINDVEQCTGDEPFCSSQWGWVVSEPARCYSNIWDQSTCLNAGLSWRFQWPYCYKEVAANATVEECYDTTMCPVESWEAKYPGWEKPANGEWTRNECRAGCYIDATHPTVQSTSENGCSISSDGQWGWASLRGNRTLCHMDRWSLQWFSSRIGMSGQDATVCATKFNASYVSTMMIYESPKYMDQTECETGHCEGTINHPRSHPDTYQWLGHQPWSESQCVDKSEKMCNKWCGKCVTDKTQFGGACFDESESILQELSPLECANNTNYTWFDCPTPPAWQQDWSQVSTICNNGDSTSNMSSTVLNQLSCRANFDRCDSQESCEARGECLGMHGWLDLETRYCDDWDWTYGDRHWANVQTTQGSGETETTVSSWKECSNRKTVPGICLSERGAWGCENNEWWRWHSLGCRTDNLRDQASCEAANNTWYNPVRNADECAQIKGCKLNRWDIRQFTEAECERCGGDVVQFATWHGGDYQTAYLRKNVWHPQGRQLKSVNDWVPKQASWKLREQLGRPIMKAFAQFKMQELLVTYNAFRSVLFTVACDCGGGDSTQCFSNLGGGDITAAQTIPDGQLVEAGSGITIQGDSATSRRRRRLSGDSNSTANATVVTVTSFSSGVHKKHEPCNGTDALLLDALVVKNEYGVVVGQLIGDGKGLNVSGSFVSALVCLDARSDMNIRDDLFTTFAVASPDENGVIRPVFFSNDTETYVERTGSQVCIEVTNVGTYFPIIRADDVLAQSNTTACSTDCGDHGTCVLNATSQTSQCVCHCGFSGDSCELGCPLYCSNQGTCNEVSNQCTCDQGTSTALYTGDDCSRMNCPVDDNNNLCSRNGECVLSGGDPYCNCTAGFEGSNCGDIVSGNTTTGEDNGFGDNTPPPSGSGVDFSVPPTGSPTTANPTASPTPAPTKPAVEPLVTVNIPVQVDFGSTNTTLFEDAIQHFEDAVADLIPESAKNLTRIEVAVESVSSGNMNLTITATLDVTTLGIIEKSIEQDQCPVFAKSCDVVVWTAGSSRPARRGLSEGSGATINYDVTTVIPSDEVANIQFVAIAPENLTNTIVEVAAEENVDLGNVTVDSVPPVQSETKLVVQALPREEALQTLDNKDETEPLDVSGIQQSMRNVTRVVAVLRGAANITVNASRVEVDMCEGRTCSNQGTCQEDGSCDCDGLYSGMQCEVPPPTKRPTRSPTKGPTKEPTKVTTPRPTSTPYPTSASPTDPPTVVEISAASTKFMCSTLLWSLAAIMFGILVK